MRARSNVPRHKRKKKIMKKAKGFFQGRRKLYRAAMETLQRAGRFSWIGRRLKKRDYRSLWIIRINAALEQFGISYSRFINALKKNNIILNRKELANMAVHHKEDFKKLVDIAKQHIKVTQSVSN